MTLSYILGLTGGSAVAYALDTLIGPQLDANPCLPRNDTFMTGLHNMSLIHSMYDVPPSEVFPG